jgi:hypothetical protein
MPKDIGIRLVFGINADVNSGNVFNFIRKIIFQDNETPKSILDKYDNDFNFYYNHNVLRKGPDPESSRSDSDDFDPNFRDAIHGGGIPLSDDIDICCFRQPCCLTKGWMKEVVIGIQVAHIYNLFISPQGIDFPILPDTLIELVKLKLSEHGFMGNPKMFFILDDCVCCK